MKKFIQAVSFLALAFIFGGISANAQAATKIDANVPFDFVIGDQFLSAGEYVIRIAATPSGAKLVEVKTKGGEIVYNALAVTNGDRGDHRSELVFDRTDGRTILTKILTEDSGYSVPVANISKMVAVVN